jgi:hypothetical protein
VERIHNHAAAAVHSHSLNASANCAALMHDNANSYSSAAELCLHNCADKLAYTHQILTFGQDADHVEEAEGGQLKGALIPEGMQVVNAHMGQ